MVQLGMVTSWKGDITPTLNGTNRVDLPESGLGLHLPQGAASFEEMNMRWVGAFLPISWPQEKKETHIQEEWSKSRSPLVCIVQQEFHKNEEQGSVTHTVSPSSETVRLSTAPLSSAPSYRLGDGG